MIDARIDTAIAILRSLESRQYKIGQARWQAVRDANEVMAAQYKNTPWGVMGLTTKFLMHPEATYLVINLCEGHYGSSQRGRVSLTRVGFTYIDDEPYAIDIDTAEVLGEMNEIATTAYDRWKPEYSYTSPMKEAAYHGFVFGSPSPRSSRTFDKWVLPLTGPALQHAAFRRQAEFATDILLGKVPASRPCWLSIPSMPRSTRRTIARRLSSAPSSTRRSLSTSRPNGTPSSSVSWRPWTGRSITPIGRTARSTISATNRASPQGPAA